MRKVINQKHVRGWEATAGVCCLLAGLLAPLLASLLTVGEWILGPAVPRWIHAAAMAFWIAAIPLIVFAGFCLDWAEQGQEKQAYDREGPVRNRA